MILKFGKRVIRNEDKNWFVKQLRKIQHFNALQSSIWKTVEYGLFNMEAKMKLYLSKHPTEFKFTKRTMVEQETLHYDIKWTQIILDGTQEFEEGEYNAALQMFSNIENYHLVKKIQENKDKIDTEVMKEYVPKDTKRGLYKTLYDKGFEKIKGITLNKALNDIGIIASVELLQQTREPIEPQANVVTATE
jgi:hypothetical protein